MKNILYILSKELSIIGSSFSICLLVLLASCYPQVEKDLTKRINTASTDILFEHYLDLGEAIATDNVDGIKESTEKLQYVSAEFHHEDLICRIEQILMQEKSQQEIYFSLTLQIQKILENSQGIHHTVVTHHDDSHQKYWLSSSSKNLENPYQ